MKKYLLLIASFFLGVALSGIFTIKVAYTIYYSQSLGMLDLHIHLVDVVEKSSKEDSLYTHKNFLCDKLDWVNTLSSTYWVSPNSADLAITSIAQDICKDFTITHPLIRHP